MRHLMADGQALMHKTAFRQRTMCMRARTIKAIQKTYHFHTSYQYQSKTNQKMVHTGMIPVNIPHCAGGSRPVDAPSSRGSVAASQTPLLQLEGQLGLMPRPLPAAQERVEGAAGAARGVSAAARGIAGRVRVAGGTARGTFAYTRAVVAPATSAARWVCAPARRRGCRRSAGRGFFEAAFMPLALLLAVDDVLWRLPLLRTG